MSEEDRALQEYGLRPSQETFLKKYMETGDIEEAAKWAERKTSTCRQWLKDPKFQQALQREQRQRLNDGAMAALQTMIEVTTDAPDPKVRVQAAKDILDRAGYKPEHMHTSADKRMENASVQEMMSRIEELQRELGLGAKQVIDQKPSDPGERAAQLPEPPRPGDADPLEPEFGGSTSGTVPASGGKASADGAGATASANGAGAAVDFVSSSQEPAQKAEQVGSEKAEDQDEEATAPDPIDSIDDLDIADLW